MKIDFITNVKIKGSYPDLEKCPTGNPVVVFTGRSNSGKSSLISAICNHTNLARVSSTPGKTRLINYFSVPNTPYLPYSIVDLPGYGFAKVSPKQKRKLRNMVDSYLSGCKDIVLMVIVLDARRDLGKEESSIIEFCQQINMPVIMARTKWDKLNTREKNQKKKSWEIEKNDKISMPLSSLSYYGLDKLITTIKSKIKEFGINENVE